MDFYYLKEGATEGEEWNVKYVVDAYHAGNVSLRIVLWAESINKFDS